MIRIGRMLASSAMLGFAGLAADAAARDNDVEPEFIIGRELACSAKVDNACGRAGEAKIAAPCTET